MLSRDNAAAPPAIAAAPTAAKPAKDSQKKEESDSPFAVAVTDVYEGPLDLLLDLIRKQDIDIYDIPSRASPRSIWPTWKKFANSM